MADKAFFPKRFQGKSFRRTWLLALLVTSILPLLTAFVLVIQMTHQESINQQRDWFLENVNNIHNQAQEKIDNVELAQTELSTFLSRYLIAPLPNTQQDSTNLQNFLNIKDNILSIELIYNIDRIRIFSDRMPFLANGDGVTFYPMSALAQFGAAQESLMSRHKEGVLQYMIIDVPRASVKGRSHTLFTPTRMISFYGSIFSMNGELLAAYTMEYTDAYFLNGIRSALENAYISLTDAEGTLIRRTGDPAGSVEGERKTKDLFVDVSTIQPVGWQLSVETKKSALGLQNTLTALYGGVLLLTFLASLVIANIVSSRTVNRLNGYLSAVNMADDDTEQLLRKLTSLVESSDAQDELDHIMMTFCKMVRDKLVLITEVNQHKLELERYKYKVLREEINPHFLYNALDTMRLCIIIGEREQATRALDALSRFYRIALSRGRDEITLAEELNMVTSYLELENIGYEGQIHWSFSVEPGLDDCLIPKFILQPLIENSIVHGKLPSENSAFHIRITVRRADERILIAVEDDGRGIDGELVNIMNQQLAGNTDIDKLGFGLFNVNQRVKLMYGAEYGLTIESSGKGVRANIVLPGNLTLIQSA